MLSGIQSPVKKILVSTTVDQSLELDIANSKMKYTSNCIPPCYERETITHCHVGSRVGHLFKFFREIPFESPLFF